VIDSYLQRTGGFDTSLERLTPRQREILQLLAEGRRMKEIARHLQLSVKTVETHRSQLMERLGLDDLASLVRYAVRTGVVALE
jgi:DNA-binding NarL/FixJ family response regulator